MIHPPTYELNAQSNPRPADDYIAFGAKQPSGAELIVLHERFVQIQRKTPLEFLAHAGVCFDVAYLARSPELAEQMLEVAKTQLDVARNVELDQEAPEWDHRVVYSARLLHEFIPRASVQTVQRTKLTIRDEKALYGRLRNLTTMSDIPAALSAIEPTPQERALKVHSRELAFHALGAWSNYRNGIAALAHPGLLRHHLTAINPLSNALVESSPLQGQRVKLIQSYDQPGAEGIVDRFESRGIKVVSVEEDMSVKSLSVAFDTFARQADREAHGRIGGDLIAQKDSEILTKRIDDMSDGLLIALGYNID